MAVHPPNESELRPGERVDDLIDPSLQIIQHPDALKFSLDAVLLAKFATAGPTDRVADLGSGGGAISLILAAKRQVAHVTGIEIQQPIRDMAERSVRLNRLDDRVTMLHADFRHLPREMWDSFDVVVSNPPYLACTEGSPIARPSIDIAKYETHCTLEDAVGAAARLLRPLGRAAFVYRPRRLPELLAGFQKAHIEPKRLRMVHAFPGRDAVLVLLEGVFLGRTGLSVLPPLFVHEPGGRFTEEMEGIYGRTTLPGHERL